MSPVETTDETLLAGIYDRCQLRAVTFSANGERFFSARLDRVEVWRMEDQKQMAILMADWDILCLAVSDDGRWIAAGTLYGEVTVWDTESYETVFAHKNASEYSDVTGLDFSPDSTRLLVASNGSEVVLWNVVTGERVLGPLDHKDMAVIAAKYSKKADRIATATAECVRVYDGHDGCLLTNIKAEVAGGSFNASLLWSNDQVFFISKNVIKEVEALTGSTISELRVQATSCYSSRWIACPKHGKFIVYSAQDVVTFWDSSTHTRLGIIQQARDIVSIALSPDDQFLTVAVEGKGKIAIHDLRRLLPLSYFPVPFIDVNDVTLDSWKQDRLEETESLLTGMITSPVQRNYCALAYRALVRAHLGHSNRAIEDAEKSIGIQPSVIGYIAKSIALIYGGKKKQGCGAIDFVFRHCDPIHVDLLLLIKAVVLFIAGEHDDALSLVGDLVTTVQLNSLSCVVQAYMYFLLGNSRVERGDYKGAIQAFKRARDQMRYYVGVPLLFISLISGWKFNDLGITIRQHFCEALYIGGCVKEAGESLINMLGKEVNMSSPITDWVSEFKLRCYGKLVYLGDTAVEEQRHGEAIAQYSVAIILSSDHSQALFIKRGKARMAERLWEDALADANEAIARDPSSPLGYEIKHAALHGAAHYVDAIDAFETMLSKMDQSPDPDIRALRGQYISPSHVRSLVRKIIQRTVRRSPHVLINTSTGCLLNKAGQEASFESLPLFSKLISSTTTRIDRDWIKREARQYFRYVMLSHRWEENEPLFQHVIHTSVYKLDESPTRDKLKMFCKIAREAGFNWAWSDTCCIDTQDRSVHQEALVSMFRWYRGSALMIVFLRGVCSSAEPGALVRSIWNTRGWTLQEYIAAKVVRFYAEDWTPYRNLEMLNHKESPEIISEMEQATRVSAQQLMALRPGLNGIREKLRLASTRHTTREEDAAYSLFGIFSVTSLPSIYGEGQSALGRLLSNVLAGSGDSSILAWNGQSSSLNSCLPARISVFKELATFHLPQRIGDDEMANIVARLGASSLDIDLALRLYDRLHKLDSPSFAGTANRMRLPCIVFELPPLSLYRSSSVQVYRAETPIFGTVEIKTRQDLSRMSLLYLVHPWLDSLLDHEDAQGGGVMEVDSAELFSPTADDEDVSDEETDTVLSFPESRSPLAPVFMSANATVAPVDRKTSALQLIARLRQPFGALLFTLASRRRAEYRRVAADSVITVQIREDVSLDDILQNVHTLDVL